MIIYSLVVRFFKGIVRTNIRLLLLGAALIFVFGAAGSYLAERGMNDQFQNLGDAAWWTIVTLATVGYGDISPKTVAGRIVAAICMVGGPVIMVSLIGAVGVQLYERWTKGVKGMMQINKTGHIIICTWNPKAADIISEIRQSRGFQNTPITIIDSRVDSKPVDDVGTSFVRGISSETATLKRANIEKARAIIILAENATPAADQKTVLTVLAAEKLNPAVFSIAEVNDTNNEEHVKRAGCDIIINTTRLSGKLMAMSLQNQTVNEIIMDLVSNTGNEVYRVLTPAIYRGRQFAEIMADAKKQYNMVLIGVETGGKVMLNPASDYALNKDDCLLVISEERPDIE